MSQDTHNRAVGARRRLVLIAFLATELGGVVLWVLAFEGVWPWSFPAALATTLGPIAVASNAWREFRFMAAFAFAFALLSWPPLWLAVGLARYLITGEALGD